MFRNFPTWRQLDCLAQMLVRSNLLLILWLTVSIAQVNTNITPDGTLGTEVTQTDNVHEITGGTRPGEGPNLFHSFDRFDVGTGDTAHFIGQPGIDNIIGRVTGGEVSMIDGTLQSDASLFLLNPQGMMFGANATLDINGSFHASTADVLRFADGAEFSTQLSAKSTLTVAEPSAFGFLHANPAGIVMQGSELEVPEGAILSIVGGDITIVGDGDPSSGSSNLSAPRGRINLASVASSGNVAFDPMSQLSELDVGSFEQLGEIAIVEGALIDVSGEGGGTVVIRGGELMIDQSWILANTRGGIAEIGIDIEADEAFILTNGGLVTTDVSGTGNAGNIQVTADDIEISNGAILGSRVFVDNGGNAGNVTITARSIQILEGGQIDTSTFGSGHGGTITVTATESVSIIGHIPEGSFAGLFSIAGGEEPNAGSAGNIFVSTPALAMEDGLMQTITVGEGNAGNIELEVGTLTLSAGTSVSQIDTRTEGNGRGGDLTISATDAIIISGHDNFGNPSGLFANTFGSGPAGMITIDTGTLVVEEGSQINTSTFGTGQGGMITVTATERVAITGRTREGFFTGLFSTSEGEESNAGSAGNISISTPKLTMEGGLIQTLTNSSGEGGGISIDVGELVVTGGAQISSSSGSQDVEGNITPGSGEGGDIKITASESVFISGFFAFENNIARSGIFNVASGSGNGGELSITTPILTMDDSARIVSRTLGGGNGGDINITDI